jgi:hypothetical protein
LAQDFDIHDRLYKNSIVNGFDPVFMRNIYVVLCVLIFAFGCTEDNVQPTDEEEVVLKNDAYEKDQNSRIYIPDFDAGQEVAATLGPLDQPYSVTHAQFFYGTTGADTQTDIILKIYRESGTTNPGSPIFMKRYTITATNEEMMHDIDLTSENIFIQNGGQIRLSIQLTNEGLPSIAHEWQGELTPGRNWIKQSGLWITSETIGFDKDFIIRAVVREGVPPVIND